MTERRPRRDVRPRLLAAVLADRQLSHRDKTYLVTVLMVRAEHVGGQRRPGSRAMNEHGKFALHLDYIARSMGSTVEAVRGARRSLMKTGWLSFVHHGTFGRPTSYQALLAGTERAPLRAAIATGLSDGRDCHPYEREDGHVRVGAGAALTPYGDSPSDPSQSSTSRAPGAEEDSAGDVDHSPTDPVASHLPRPAADRDPGADLTSDTGARVGTSRTDRARDLLIVDPIWPTSPRRAG